jgi:hypothetical protein
MDSEPVMDPEPVTEPELVRDPEPITDSEPTADFGTPGTEVSVECSSGLGHPIRDLAYAGLGLAHGGRAGLRARTPPPPPIPELTGPTYPGRTGLDLDRSRGPLVADISMDPWTLGGPHRDVERVVGCEQTCDDSWWSRTEAGSDERR